MCAYVPLLFAFQVSELPQQGDPGDAGSLFMKFLQSLPHLLRTRAALDLAEDGFWDGSSDELLGPTLTSLPSGGSVQASDFAFG
jgi:hypothetical protein